MSVAESLRRELSIAALTHQAAEQRRVKLGRKEIKFATLERVVSVLHIA